MRTRTLLLLALGCGLAIMLAGAVFLFQLSNQEDVAEPSPLGEPVRVGDMTVVVEGSAVEGAELHVTVAIGGVDDLDGAAGFRLLTSDGPAPLLPAAEGDCAATTVAEEVCRLRFDGSGLAGTSRTLFYDRGEDGARWVLAT